LTKRTPFADEGCGPQWKGKVHRLRGKAVFPFYTFAASERALANRPRLKVRSEVGFEGIGLSMSKRGFLVFKDPVDVFFNVLQLVFVGTAEES
jgi:hypothetical protein